MHLSSFTPQRLRRRVFSQLWMLGLQLVLGMLLNLISQAAHVVYTIVLILHIANAIGLVEGAVFIALKEQSKLSWWTAGMLFITSVSGVVTLLTHHDIWSFIMTCGFLASSWLTGMLYIRADRQVQRTNRKTPSRAWDKQANKLSKGDQ